MVDEAIKSYSKIESETTSEEDLSFSSETTPTQQKKRNYELVPEELNKKIKKWIKYYSVKDRERFQRFLNRGAKYKEVIEDLLVENHLPPDLYYLGIIESGYVTSAVSRVGAVGPWQFMLPTAREYGLQVNYYVDERQDPIRSTEAAIKYLRWLYQRKGSWHLALAAYNAGPGRVKRAMRRGRTKDYWKLTKRRLLPRDTREYVSQFLAALTIGRNLEKFGFHERADVDYPDVELVDVPSPVKLSRIAEKSKIPLKTLKQINPHLTKSMTPPGSKTYGIWVPQPQVKTVAALNSQLQKFKIKGIKPRRYLANYKNTKIHRVRRGQTLGHIARKYRLSLSYLKRINRLKSDRIYVGQRLRVKTSTYKRSHTYHVVRRGQTLGGIARRYRLSLSQLKRLNRLRSSKIIIGQRLRVKNRHLASRKAKTSKKTIRYRVRRGDNLSTIANNFRTSVYKIKRMNRLRGSQIYPGQFLKIAKN